MNSAKQIIRNGGIAAGVAAIVNLVVLAIGRAADVSLLVPGPGSSVPDTALAAVPVIITSALPILLGVAVAALLIARGRHRLARWLVIAGGVLTVASLVPLAAMGIDGGTGTVLGVMHLIVGGAFLAATARAVRSPAVRTASEVDAVRVA